MSVKNLNLELRLGAAVPSPVPAGLITCLQSVQVTRSDEAPCGFQLQFNADRDQNSSSDYALLQNPLLQEANRLILSVIMNGQTYVLIDGLITGQELSHDSASGKASLTVTGEDISVVMDIAEYSRQYPMMADWMIVEYILGFYATYGIVPDVHGAIQDLPPIFLERVPQQSGTDRQCIQNLAQQYGFVFCMRPGPVPGMNSAYWGTPPRTGTPQPPLNVDMGPLTNVQTISFQHNPMAAQYSVGVVQDAFLETLLPVITHGPSGQMVPLAARAGMADNPGLGHVSLFADSGAFWVTAQLQASSQTDASLQQVVTVQGTLDGLRYGTVLDAPGLVDLRGTGDTYDGRYYVKSVTHTIQRGQYQQDFVLTREGRGSSIHHIGAAGSPAPGLL